MIEKVINKNGIKMKNERLLFENKIFINKDKINVNPKIFFRNDTLNNIINGFKNFDDDNKKLREEKCSYINNYKCNFNKNSNYFKKTNALKLPSLSEKSLKINNIINSNNTKDKNKRYDFLFNNNYINSNNDSQKDKYINKIMQSCCSVVKMNLPKKKINGKECFILKKLDNKNISYKPIILYKNRTSKTRNSINRYKRIKHLPSDSLYKNNIKLLVNEETMTNYNINKNDNTKNNESNSDFFISSKIFNIKNHIKNYFQLNTHNFNSNYSNK